MTILSFEETTLPGKQNEETEDNIRDIDDIYTTNGLGPNKSSEQTLIQIILMDFLTDKQGTFDSCSREG